MIRPLIAKIGTFALSRRALTPLCLVMLMAALVAGSVQAVAKPSDGPSSSARVIAAEAEEGESKEEEEEEEEIEVELEFEEGEEAGEEGVLPAACRLHTATPQVVAHFDRGDMRLTLRYTSDASLRVGVSYWLKGARGTLRLGSTTRHIGRRGVISLSRQLDERAIAKLRAARTIVVQLAVPHTPSSCRRFLTMHLSPVGPLSSGATWYAPA